MYKDEVRMKEINQRRGIKTIDGNKRKKEKKRNENK
jgi:hypothetical protein